MSVAAPMTRTFTLADVRWGSRDFPATVIVGWLVVNEFILQVGPGEYAVTQRGFWLSVGLISETE